MMLVRVATFTFPSKGARGAPRVLRRRKAHTWPTPTTP